MHWTLSLMLYDSENSWILVCNVIVDGIMSAKLKKDRFVEYVIGMNYLFKCICRWTLILKTPPKIFEYCFATDIKHVCRILTRRKYVKNWVQRFYSKDKNEVKKAIRWMLHNVFLRNVPQLFLKVVVVPPKFKLFFWYFELVLLCKKV